MARLRPSFVKNLTVGLLLTLGLSGCGMYFGGDVDNSGPEASNRVQSKTHSNYDTSYGSIFGEGGANIFGADDPATQDNTGIGVNSYLWRATLDTVAFMPLASADPFGGVIITDWYSPPETPGERVKVNVFILGRDLTADGLKATVFRQVQQGGAWVDQPVAAATVTQLEDAILTRARQLRIAQLQ